MQRMALLQELGDEVRLDLEMKSLIFKNRELVVLILDDIGALLNEPSGLEREMRTKSSFNSGQLTQRKLATEIQNRLATIRCYLAFLADLFFCSDAVENRVYALSVSPSLTFSLSTRGFVTFGAISVGVKLILKFTLSTKPSASTTV